MRAGIRDCVVDVTGQVTAIAAIGNSGPAATGYCERRRNPSMPTRPLARRASVAGSATGDPETSNVMGTSAGITEKLEAGTNEPGEEVNDANPTVPTVLGSSVPAYGKP